MKFVPQQVDELMVEVYGMKSQPSGLIAPSWPMYTYPNVLINPNWMGSSTVAFGPNQVPIQVGSGGYHFIGGDGTVTASSPIDVERRDMPVVGFRAWQAKTEFKLGHGFQFHLTSTAQHAAWEPGENVARCTASAGHSAPDPLCGCGFYVLANLDEVQTHVKITESVVVGAVMGWGRVVQHADEGWRAEKVRIVAFLDAKYSKKQEKKTQEAARAYGVEILSRSGLESLVTEYGDPLEGQI